LNFQYQHTSTRDTRSLVENGVVARLEYLIEFGDRLHGGTFYYWFINETTVEFRVEVSNIEEEAEEIKD